MTQIAKITKLNSKTLSGFRVVVEDVEGKFYVSVADIQSSDIKDAEEWLEENFPEAEIQQSGR